jgi:cysteine desulfurase
MLTTRSVFKHLLRNSQQKVTVSAFSTSTSTLNATPSSKPAPKVDKYQELKKLKVRPLYLDAQATCPVDPRVLDAMLPYLTNMYGNPQSRTHAYGWESEKAVEDAREV